MSVVDNSAEDAQTELGFRDVATKLYCVSAQNVSWDGGVRVQYRGTAKIKGGQDVEIELSITSQGPFVPVELPTEPMRYRARITSMHPAAYAEF